MERKVRSSDRKCLYAILFIVIFSYLVFVSVPVLLIEGSPSILASSDGAPPPLMSVNSHGAAPPIFPEKIPPKLPALGSPISSAACSEGVAARSCSGAHLMRRPAATVQIIAPGFLGCVPALSQNCPRPL